MREFFRNFSRNFQFNMNEEIEVSVPKVGVFYTSDQGKTWRCQPFSHGTSLSGRTVSFDDFSPEQKERIGPTLEQAILNYK